MVPRKLVNIKNTITIGTSKEAVVNIPAPSYQ